MRRGRSKKRLLVKQRQRSASGGITLYLTHEVGRKLIPVLKSEVSKGLKDLAVLIVRAGEAQSTKILRVDDLAR